MLQTNNSLGLFRRQCFPQNMIKHVRSHSSVTNSWFNTIYTWFGWSTPLKVTLLQKQQLEHIWDRMRQPYIVGDPGHQQVLRDLWILGFPGEPCTALKCERWKDMGWQGPDPTTDIRGAGLYGVQNLIYFAHKYPTTFDRLMNKKTGRRAEWEYPFAAAGLNLTYAIAELLGFKHARPSANPDDRPPLPIEHMAKQPAFAGFLPLLGQEPRAFEELYCITFCVLDDEWLEQEASYMQFNALLKDVLARVDKALKSRPRSLAQLQDMLGVSVGQPVSDLS